MTYEEALRWAAKELKNREGMSDARKLVGHLGVDVGSSLLSPSDEIYLKEMVEDRKQGKPVAQILGYRDFWKDRFIVTKDVLDPRPETEHLIEAAIEFSRPDTILDLGTGSGCIALSLAREFPDAKINASDCSWAALSIAKKNAIELGLGDRVSFFHSDWFENVTQSYDLIVSNPPYIAQSEFVGLELDVLFHEPDMALSPGGNGLRSYIEILKNSAGHLNPGWFDHI